MGRRKGRKMLSYTSLKGKKVKLEEVAGLGAKKEREISLDVFAT
jgi:hypothetical protein